MLALSLLICSQRSLAASEYTLLNPTPEELLRPLSADRPDRTESAYTVDAGHLQLELDLVRWTVARAAGPGEREGELAFTPLNLKVGVLHNLDLQLLVETVSLQLASPPAEDAWALGLDVTVRAKVNLLGNDGGKVAVAVMPFAVVTRLTSALGSELQWGILVPVAVSLPFELTLGTTVGLELSRPTPADPFSLTVGGSAALERKVAGPVGAFVELFAAATPSSGGLEITLDGGVTVQLGTDFELDGGVYVPLSSGPDALVAFVGGTVRL